MQSRPELDAIIIADSGIDTLSGTSPLKLQVDGRVGAVQTIASFIRNNGRIIDPVPGEDRCSWAAAPKLNGLYLYSFLSGLGHRVELVQNYRNEKDRFAGLLDGQPAAVVISTSFIFFKKTLCELAAEIRSQAPGTCIIAGGSFVYYSYLLRERARQGEYAAKAAAGDFLFLQVDDEPDIDLYIVSPRGEDTLHAVLHNLREGRSPGLPAWSSVLDGSRYTFGPRTGHPSHGNSMEIDWTTLPASIFTAEVIPLQASNGCPYNCAFCNFTKDRRQTFVKSLDRLVAEMRMVRKRGIRYVWFVDDNFRLGRNDLDEVCRRLVNEETGIKWMCFIRAGTLKNADMNLLRRAGCQEVQIGLESGDPGVLRNMNKQADPEMYAEVIGSLLHNGINVSCYFISGFPGETEASAARTREFIRSIEHPEAPGSLSWSIYPFLLTPLSPVYEPEMRQKFGLEGYMTDWSHRTMDFQQAKKLVLKAFLELENSGPIYREDNLDILAAMPPERRKTFFKARHLLAKKSLREKPQPAEIIGVFSDILD
jgi:radical SAM superfamily enzyme YgiQ (UPF0313 family)